MSKGTDLRVKNLLDKIAMVGPEEFASSFPIPMLIALGSQHLDEGSLVTRAVYAMDDNAFLKKRVRFDPRALVTKIEKRDGANHYSNMVIMGRSDKSDIQVNNSEVSKMHSYFAWEERPNGKVLKVADGNSRNGTRVDGKKLEPNKPYELKSGEIISLGSAVFFRFYFPDKLYTTLKAMSAY